jgi:hypothetical protein
MTEPSDHDLLIRIDERVRKLDRAMANHLAHHWTVSIAVLGAVLTALASLAVALGTR